MPHENGRARIIEKWRRRHARLQREFEAAADADPQKAESIRHHMADLAIAIRRYSENRQGELIRRRR